MLFTRAVLCRAILCRAISCRAIDILEYAFDLRERRGRTAVNHKRYLAPYTVMSLLHTLG